MLAEQFTKCVRFTSITKLEKQLEDDSDLVIRRKKVLKKKKILDGKQEQQQQKSNENAQINTDDDYDTFAIVSQEEIDKV